MFADGAHDQGIPRPVRAGDPARRNAALAPVAGDISYTLPTRRGCKRKPRRSCSTPRRPV